MSEPFLLEATNEGDVLRLPRRFGVYEIQEIIGTGGTAVVAAVEDSSKGCRLAAKFLRRPHANTPSMRLVERELRLCVTMSNPYIVNCIDVVYLDDLVCVIMEHFNGRDLIDALANDAVGIQTHWESIFSQMCLGIQYLHSCGFAHRDVKQENVIIDANYNCKLCDFGIMCESRQPTLATTICGTVPYMSPEIVRGEKYDAKKADIWALGITLYTMMTGYFPWRTRSTSQLCREIAEGDFAVGGLPGAVARVVARCCDVNPESRATVDELLAMPFAIVPMGLGVTSQKTLPNLFSRTNVRGDVRKLQIKRAVSNVPKRARKPGVFGRAGKRAGMNDVLCF